MLCIPDDLLSIKDGQDRRLLPEHGGGDGKGVDMNLHGFCSCEFSDFVFGQSNFGGDGDGEGPTGFATPAINFGHCKLSASTYALAVVWNIVTVVALIVMLLLAYTVIRACYQRILKFGQKECVSLWLFVWTIAFIVEQLSQLRYVFSQDQDGQFSARLLQQQWMGCMFSALSFIILLASFVWLLACKLSSLMHMAMSLDEGDTARMVKPLVSFLCSLTLIAVIAVTTITKTAAGSLNILTTLYVLLMLGTLKRMRVQFRRQSFSNVVGDIRIHYHRVIRIVNTACYRIHRACFLFALSTLGYGCTWFIGRAYVNSILLSHVSASFLVLKSITSVAIMAIVLHALMSMYQLQHEQVVQMRTIQLVDQGRKLSSTSISMDSKRIDKHGEVVQRGEGGAGSSCSINSDGNDRFHALNLSNCKSSSSSLVSVDSPSIPPSPILPTPPSLALPFHAHIQQSMTIPQRARSQVIV
jgi:hypothetical protein